MILIANDTFSQHHRSRAARSAFVHEHPCPSTGKSYGPCEGYQVDHIKALENGGPDIPTNMQWLTIEEHKAKTKRDNDEARGELH